ncbi:hypothetical protein [Thermus sp.]
MGVIVAAPLLDIAYARLSTPVFALGVGGLAGALLLGEVPWWTGFFLYPWWRLWRGWRLLLFPNHLRLLPPLGLGRRIGLEEVEGLERAYWPAGPLSRGREALVLVLKGGERLPLPLEEALGEQIRELLARRTSGSGFPGG